MCNKDFVSTVFSRTLQLAYSENSSSIAQASWRAKRPRFPIFTRIISFRALKYKVGALPWQNCRVKRAWHRLWGITIGGWVRYAYSAVQGPPCARKLAPFVHPRPIQAHHGLFHSIVNASGFSFFFFFVFFSPLLSQIHAHALNYHHWIFDEAHPRKFDIEVLLVRSICIVIDCASNCCKTQTLELKNFPAILGISIKCERIYGCRNLIWIEMIKKVNKSYIGEMNKLLLFIDVSNYYL